MEMDCSLATFSILIFTLTWHPKLSAPKRHTQLAPCPVQHPVRCAPSCQPTNPIPVLIPRREHRAPPCWHVSLWTYIWARSPLTASLLPWRPRQCLHAVPAQMKSEMSLPTANCFNSGPIPASKFPAKIRASWWAERSSGNQADDSRVRIIETIPTVQLFLDSSEALSGGTLEAGSNYRTMLSLASSYKPNRRLWLFISWRLIKQFYYCKLHLSCNHRSIKITWEMKSGSRSDWKYKESACNAGDPGSIPGLGRSTGEGIGYPLQYSWDSLVAQLGKNLPAMQEIWVWSLGWEDPLEKGKATHFSILAWRIPWTV